MSNQSFTSEEIADYIGEEPRNDLDISSIEVCVQIIGAHEPGTPGRNPDLVGEAFESILQWAADYGVKVVGNAIVEVDE